MGDKKRAKRAAKLRKRHGRLQRIRGSLTKSSAKAKLNKIYVQGCRPAVAFGSEINGVTKAEWKVLQRTLLAGQTLRQAGTSLTDRLCLIGDPAWKQAMAPARQWAMELWKAANFPDEANNTPADLVKQWNEAQPEKVCTWAGSRGPLARAVLSLQRVGWEVCGPTVWRNDKNQRVDVPRVSPSLLDLMFKESVQRLHEREAGRRLGFGERRACYEHIAKWMPPAPVSKRDETIARSRFLVRSVVCGGLWTEDRLCKARFLSTGLCPKCGEPDSLHHRALVCADPEVAAARAAKEPAWMPRMARNEPSNRMWTKVVFPHPGDVTP